MISSWGSEGRRLGQREELNRDEVITELWSWDGPAELSHLGESGQTL